MRWDALRVAEKHTLIFLPYRATALLDVVGFWNFLDSIIKLVYLISLQIMSDIIVVLID